MFSTMTRMMGLGPKRAKKKKSRRATLGAVPEYKKQAKPAPLSKGGRAPLGAIQEKRELPKARKARRSMRRHSLGARPALSPDEKTLPKRKGKKTPPRRLLSPAPAKKSSSKKSPPAWETFALEKGFSPRPQKSPPPPGTPAEVRRLRKRVSELEAQVSRKEPSLDEVEAELLAAYATLLAAADLGFDTHNYEKCVEALSTRATEHPDRPARDAELRSAFVQEEVRGPATEALALVRGLVPSDLSSGGTVSVERLVDAGLPVKVAHRVSRTRALWLTRVHPSEIATMHASDLVNTRATVTLDLVEARAVWCQCVRVDFKEHDGDGRKQAWFEELERRVRTLAGRQQDGDLSPKDTCHPAYDRHHRECGPFSDAVLSPERGFAPCKSGAYLPTPQPYSAKRRVVANADALLYTPAPDAEFPPFSETERATPCSTQADPALSFPETAASPHSMSPDVIRVSGPASPEVIRGATQEVAVDRRRASVDTHETMAFIEATIAADDAAPRDALPPPSPPRAFVAADAPPPPPQDATDSTTSSRKSVTWRLPEPKPDDWFDTLALKAKQARAEAPGSSSPKANARTSKSRKAPTRIAPRQGVGVAFADDALRRFVEQNGLSAYAAAILGVADALDDLVEMTDEDVDELAAETGMPKLKQRKLKRALAGLRGACEA